ncbi:MAG: ectonucleotide pyrophosphatase/phosphodiesterase [Ginsengibacter sp.]|jgi:predicted AlkP superfamily pyrophosphatase or phosphodiesterase
MKRHFQFFAYPLLLLFLFSGSTVLFAQDTTQYIVPGRLNDSSQLNKPYVILISADGFRYDFAKNHHANNLLKFAENGVEAASMQPSFPSLTFPNHYSIATGLYPSHHGIVDNRFYDFKKDKFYSISNKKIVGDGSWYGGEPIWVLAERHKMLSASFFWVGSEAAIDHVRPTYYYNYTEAFSIDKRLDVLQDWLKMPADMRPHLITFYFPEVDHAAHAHGINSKETGDAVKLLDDAIEKMNAMCAQTGLPINFIFVSDHGFVDVDTVNTLQVPSFIDTSKFIISTGSTMVHLYAKDSSAILSSYNSIKKVQNGYQTYLANEVPEKWHYGKKDDRYNRIGDIILVADLAKVFYSRGRKNPATHGFDNYTQEMQATFYAWGPAFKQHLKIDRFENVNIYPLIAHILGLSFDYKIDGNLNVLKGILK